MDDMEVYSGKDKTYTTMDMTAIHCPASYFTHTHTHTHTHTKYRNMDITFTHTFFSSPDLFNELKKKKTIFVKYSCVRGGECDSACCHQTIVTRQYLI